MAVGKGAVGKWAVGKAAEVAASIDVTITTSVGNAAAAGSSASIVQSFTLTTNVGNAVAAGITAAIETAGAVEINCYVGSAVAAGVLANIATNVAIGASIGNAVAAGLSGSVAQAFTVTASTGNAVADGSTAGISGASSVTCSVGAATAEGLPASITVTTIGTGTLTPETIAEIADAVWSHTTAVDFSDKMLICSRILRNRMVTDPITGIMTIYDDDNITPYLTAQLYENVAETQTYRGQGAEVRARLT